MDATLDDITVIAGEIYVSKAFRVPRPTEILNGHLVTSSIFINEQLTRPICDDLFLCGRDLDPNDLIPKVIGDNCPYNTTYSPDVIASYVDFAAEFEALRELSMDLAIVHDDDYVGIIDEENEIFRVPDNLPTSLGPNGRRPIVKFNLSRCGDPEWGPNMLSSVWHYKLEGIKVPIDDPAHPLLIFNSLLDNGQRYGDCMLQSRPNDFASEGWPLVMPLRPVASHVLWNFKNNMPRDVERNVDLRLSDSKGDFSLPTKHVIWEGSILCPDCDLKIYASRGQLISNLVAFEHELGDPETDIGVYDVPLAHGFYN